jgi:hypothetical protein
MVAKVAKVVLYTNETGPRGSAVQGSYGIGPPEHWDREFESRSRHGYMSTFFSVVLSRIRKGFAMDRSPIQEVKPKHLKVCTVSGVNN